MASLHSPRSTTLPLILLLLISFVNLCLGSRKLSSLYQPPPTILTYHGRALLEGHIPISILWYGKFSPAQRSIISDFLLSLTPTRHHLPTTAAAAATTTPAPSVSKWWTTVDSYVQEAGKKNTHILLTNQLLDEDYSMGKYLRRPQISELAGRLGVMRSGLAVVLTAEDVAVEGFCSSACGLHASRPAAGAGGRARAAYIWVGNAEGQCPGQCAWPFHRPVYGPQGPALGPPNGDVGADGMVINLATLVAGAVTNPFGGGFFQGNAAAPVEVAGACPGVYGRGAYPGYAGQLRVDPATGGSYNVVGVNGRKYLVPALLDPVSHSCVPMV
ncbi:protein PHOSPHATE-INDUCED 1-like [Phoenix dactylifera]|uniref:Protein PHOSPHATE-INDUCED 1-like n=1 Tax=Phoenix dactylifera TaxID=42345 RepID=A0A8B7CR90_PHODC|nr:protein PHOSPHATE-INDUCED 1-like [Phoenix dactylifera]